MKRIFVLFSLGLMAALVFWPQTIAHLQNQASRSAYVIDLKLDDHVVLPCICKGDRLPHTRSDGRTPVSVAVNNPDDNPLNYRYSVTGGRIVGQGPAVIWDFNDNFAPGEYSITVEVDDGIGGRAKSVTKTVKVAEPSCHCPCECPTIEVFSHYGEVRRGQTLEFEARLFGGELKDTTFTWTVENGIITSGRGTPAISVVANRNTRGPEVRATVEIGGTNPSCGCPTSASQSVPIGRRTEIQDYPSEVRSISLDDKTLYIACPRGHARLRNSRASDDMIINVSTAAIGNTIRDNLTYYYKVTGGTVFGSGPDIRWDLSGMNPGTYSISVDVDDGSGISTGPKKEVVTVAERTCQDLVECPAIELSNVRKIKNSNDFIVSSSISGFLPDEARIIWSAFGGQIIAGQGTRSVRVRSSMNASAGEPSVSLKLDLPEEQASCPNVFSRQLSIATPYE